MIKKYALFGLVVVMAAVATVAVMSWATVSGDRTTTRVTVESVQDVAKLATINMYVSTYQYWTKPKEWYEWKNANILVLASGSIQGRMNLEKAKIDISEDEERPSVNIDFAPDAVEVSELEVGKGDIKCVDVNNPNVLNPINARDRNRAIEAAMKKLKQTAADMGIGEKTKEEAQTVLEQFFASLGYQCNVTFAPADGESEPAFAPSAPGSLKLKM